jgi:MFS family permease
MTAPSEPTSILSPGIRPVTISILLAMGLVAFDTLSVITMLPAITADLGHVELLSWIVTAFLLTSTITILVAGPIIDRWGLRVTFHVSLVILVAASIGASVAPTMELLVISRAVQGIGGGAALTVSFAAIGIAIPQGLRTQSYAANAAVWGVASLAGPGVAAALISFASWRLVFLLNVPLGLAAFLVSSRHLPGRRPGAADYWSRCSLPPCSSLWRTCLVGRCSLSPWEQDSAWRIGGTRGVCPTRSCEGITW